MVTMFFLIGFAAGGAVPERWALWIPPAVYAVYSTLILASNFTSGGRYGVLLIGVLGLLPNVAGMALGSWLRTRSNRATGRYAR